MAVLSLLLVNPQPLGLQEMSSAVGGLYAPLGGSLSLEPRLGPCFQGPHCGND